MFILCQCVMCSTCSSPRVQKIIRKYTELSGNGNMHSALASALGCLTWENPSFSEFQQLARYVIAFS